MLELPGSVKIDLPWDGRGPYRAQTFFCGKVMLTVTPLEEETRFGSRKYRVYCDTCHWMVNESCVEPAVWCRGHVNSHYSVE